MPKTNSKRKREGRLEPGSGRPRQGHAAWETGEDLFPCGLCKLVSSEKQSALGQGEKFGGGG